MIYLASASPRRRELLKLVDIHYELLLVRNQPRPSQARPDVIEVRSSHETAAEYVSRIAREKAELGWEALHWRHLPLHPVLSADTEVILDDEVFGKPKDAVHAQHMLEKLSGKTHEVRSAICLVTARQVHEAVSVSHVTFPVLSTEQILHYISSGESFGKAGGYGLQGKAARFIQHIDGSPSGIIGLPLFETVQLLRAAGISDQALY